MVLIPVGQGIADCRVALYCHADNKEDGATHGDPEVIFIIRAVSRMITMRV